GSVASGDRLEVSTSGTITNYGSVTHHIESVKIFNGDDDVTSSYQNIEKEDGTLSITKREVTLKSATWTKEYDGTALTNASGLAASANPQAPNEGVVIGGDGFVDGEGVDSYTFNGSQILVNTSKNAFTYKLKSNTTEGENGNYIISKTEGDLIVTGRQTKYAVKVKANSDTVKYNGSEHPVSGFVTGGDSEDAALTNVKNTAKGLEFTEGDVKFYVTGISASLSKKDVLRKIDSTDVESYTVEVNGEAVIKDENGNAVSDQFDVTVLDGTLTINPRNVTLTSASGEREYDGTELTSAWLVANNKAYVNNELVDKEVVVTGDGFADKEGATYEVTGSQTYVGGETGNNDFTYTLKDNTKACNYNISTVDGTLTVTNRTEKIDLDLTANSGEFFYNGEERTVSGFKTTTFIYNGRTYHVSGLVSTRTETDVNYDATKKAEKSYPVSVTGTAKVEVEDGDKLVDVTDQCDVEVKTYGTLLIKQRNVTMTSASGEKEYDGTALTSAWLVANNKATVDGKPVTAQVIENTYNSETGEGFANNEGATYTVTGSQTRVGGDPENNTFTYTLNQGTKASNYNITTVNGTLKVTGRDQKYKITVTAKSGTFTYDGTAHEVSGFVTGEGTPYTETTNGLEFYEGNVKYYVAGISASGSATNVNDAGVVAITGTLGVFDSDNENVT
ncbi:MAG: hypothetical protein J6M44_09305, partial [Butyrivibrio sp.]|nr:hypothetical protein [Butyrivibrio sp.]